MALSLFHKRAMCQIRNVRCPKFYSTASLIDVKVDDKSGCATVTMQNPPVNAMSLEMMQTLTKTLIELESNKCKGLVLTSSLPTVFSAGLDLKQLYQTTPEKLLFYWSALQTLWLKFYGSKMPTVALINGHGPAGGCLLSLCCDYRVMVAGKSKIGLNESQFSIVVPFWLKDAMCNVIGTRKGELALILGSLFSPEEALKIGLVDEVAHDLPSANEIAQAQLKKFLKIPATARSLSKLAVRGPELKNLSGRLQEDAERFTNHTLLPSTQKYLESYLDSLKKKK